MGEDEEEKSEEVSPLGFDLLGKDYQSADGRNWYEVDLWNDPVIIPLEEDENDEDENSGYSSADTSVEDIQQHPSIDEDVVEKEEMKGKPKISAKEKKEKEPTITTKEKE